MQNILTVLILAATCLLVFVRFSCILEWIENLKENFATEFNLVRLKEFFKSYNAPEKNFNFKSC